MVCGHACEELETWSQNILTGVKQRSESEATLEQMNQQVNLYYRLDLDSTATKRFCVLVGQQYICVRLQQWKQIQILCPTLDKY